MKSRTSTTGYADIERMSNDELEAYQAGLIERLWSIVCRSCDCHRQDCARCQKRHSVDSPKVNG